MSSLDEAATKFLLGEGHEESNMRSWYLYNFLYVILWLHDEYQSKTLLLLVPVVGWVFTLGAEEQGRAKRPAVWGGAARPVTHAADASRGGGEADGRSRSLAGRGGARFQIERRLGEGVRPMVVLLNPSSPHPRDGDQQLE